MAEADFPEKVLFSLKWGKFVQNRCISIFCKMVSLFLLEVPLNESHDNSLFSSAKHIPRKILIHRLWVKMCLASQIAGLFNHQYLWK